MKIKFVVLIAMTFLIFGCSSTYRLQKDKPAEFEERFNVFAAQNEGEIETLSGSRFKTRVIGMKEDSVFWNNPEGKTEGSIDMRRISKIKFINSGRGALEGLGVGILIGFSTGALLGFASGDDEPGFLSFTAEEKAGILGVTFGALGGIFGLIAGATSGHKDVFILNEPGAYFAIVNAEIVGETSDRMRLRWRGKTFDIRKLDALIKEKDGRTIIYVLREKLTQSLNETPK